MLTKDKSLGKNENSVSTSLPCVVPTRVKSGLVHGLSWKWLAAPSTPWLRATVSNLSAIFDARQWSVARLPMKSWDGNHYTFYFNYSWYQSGFPAIQFHSLPASATVIVFHGMSPLLIDGTRKTISLARWLEDMEIIFRVCHIESAPSSSASHTLWASAAKGFRIRCYYRGRDNSIYGISSGPEHAYLPAPIDDAGILEPLFESDNNKVATPEDSPGIIIANDDDEEDTEEEIEDVEVNPEKILFGNDD
ncbi:hypothetical protein TIFTF001_039195 [Ficus carica]|uniref:Uncharacterized protein n=1 Tax=Ficus carica TaxID=3494 RepID=A0AA88EAD2_FICCA|nr:hypothetical protein TIFTF001_039195 [Ficus carica]